MQNRLYKGYLVVRENGTQEKYLGWEPDEIKAIENVNHGYRGSLDFSRKYYSIENSFLHYIYNDEAVTFSIVNDKYDTITVWESDSFDGLANYLLDEATEDEERSGAIVEMALDVFGSWEEWNKRVLYHRIKETEADFRYVKECKTDYDNERYFL
ncbi:MAG: hypothetical protein IKE23_00660 [Exiguobacterium sp.]|nr:hypothetical protein [Exiguobacterium sp.]